MAKAQTFADKVSKIQRVSSSVCPECNTEYSYILHISSEKSDKSGAWKFNRRHTRVCKCNEKELYK